MKYCYYLFVVVFLLVACDNVSFSPLIGKWQLKTVEKSGEIVPVDTVWYNFQSISIFSLQIYVPQSDVYVEYIGFRTQEDDVVSIRLEDESVTAFHPDWKSVNRSFTIEKVNRKSLLLRSEEGYVYSFIKF
jgi:hypothetical protein